MTTPCVNTKGRLDRFPGNTAQFFLKIGDTKQLCWRPNKLPQYTFPDFLPFFGLWHFLFFGTRFLIHSDVSKLVISPEEIISVPNSLAIKWYWGCFQSLSVLEKQVGHFFLVTRKNMPPLIHSMSRDALVISLSTSFIWFSLGRLYLATYNALIPWIPSTAIGNHWSHGHIRYYQRCLVVDYLTHTRKKGYQWNLCDSRITWCLGKE